MMRVLIVLSTLALLGALAWRSLPALAQVPQPAVHPESVALLPDLTEVQRVRMHQEMAPTFQRYMELARAFGPASSAERAEMRREMQGLVDRYEAWLHEKLTPEQYERARAIPHGPQAAERFAHAQVLETPGLTGEQVNLLASLGEAALQAGKDLDKEARERVEGRYWLLVSLVLEPAQMAALDDRLPVDLKTRLDPQNFLFLPGITASQANRLRAELEALEAEVQGPKAELQALERQEPKDFERLAPLREEILTRRDEAVQAALAVLTEEQRQAFRAIPPLLTLPEVARGLDQLAHGLNLDPGQRQALEEMARPLKDRHEALKPRIEELQKAMDGRDFRDPRAMETSMQLKDLRVGLEAEKIALARRALALVRPDQLRRFVAEEPAPPPDPERVERLKARGEEVRAEAERWVREGRDPRPVAGDLRQRVEDLVRQGRMDEAEALLDEALEKLRGPAREGATDRPAGSRRGPGHSLPGGEPEGGDPAAG